jgi:hypothetical protein
MSTRFRAAVLLLSLLALGCEDPQAHLLLPHASPDASALGSGVSTAFLPASDGTDPYANVGALTPFERRQALDLARYCPGDGVTDCTGAIGRWLSDGRTQGRHLYVSPGTYLYGETRRLFNGVQIRCANRNTTVFKNTNPVQAYFVLGEKFGGGPHPYSDVRIENCGFDMNAAQANFASAIVIRGGSSPERMARNITIRGNRIFDSSQPGQMYVERERQRQYIVVLAAEDVLIESNRLSEGGRIKAGRPGSQIVIRGNRLHNVNDNGITVVNYGDYFGHHYLIENNRITNALGAGIFFGSDGTAAGRPEQAVTDITIRNNTISGGQSACIQGTLPNHASRIDIRGNSCSKVATEYTYGNSFDTGIGIIRAANSSLPVEDFSVQENVVTNMSGSSFGNGAIFLRGLHSNTCVLNNRFQIGASTAMRLSLSSESLAKETGSILNGASIRQDGDFTFDQSGNTQGCWLM